MTWGSFVNYWIMRELGQEDAIARNYDLMRFAEKRPGRTDTVGLSLALQRVGIPLDYKQDALNYIPEVGARLEAMGYPRTDYEVVRKRLLEWYTWDRIRRGDIRQWFMAEHIKQKRR